MIEKLYKECLPEFILNDEQEYNKYYIYYEANCEGYCPCGSGGKYKLCHFKEVENEKKKRDQLKKNTIKYCEYICRTSRKMIEESSGEFKKIFKKLVEKPNSPESLWACIATDEDNILNSCCGKRMSSHTIYKSKALSILGDLLEIDKFELRTVDVITDNPNAKPQSYDDLKSLGFDTIADKSASKVNVLCINHDEELFRSIEQEISTTNQDNYIFCGRDQQSNAYSIRALILEYYAFILHLKRQQELLKKMLIFFLVWIIKKHIRAMWILLIF